jgi:hypothetical protein
MSVIAIGNQLPRDTLAGSAMLARSRSGVEVPGNAAKPQADYSHRGENRLMAVVFQHPITITDFGHVSPNNFGTGWRRDIKERTRWITRQRWPDAYGPGSRTDALFHIRSGSRGRTVLCIDPPKRCYVDVLVI